MRLKCQTAEFKISELCRLCGRPVEKGYKLKGVITGCACEDCYRRFYGPMEKQLAFHWTDIFSRSFWRPFHIADHVEMFPAISASAVRSVNDVARRLIPVILILAILSEGTGIVLLKGLPGHGQQILTQILQTVRTVGTNLSAVWANIPSVAGHLKDAGMMLLSAVLRITEQLASLLP